MKRKPINFFEISKNLLSPGDVYWIKRSGEEILISSKGDILNLNLISKLDQQSQKVVIENYIDETDLLEIKELFDRFHVELLIKDKNVYREKIFKFFYKKIVDENKSDNELNIIFWKMFSELGFEFGSKLVEKDRDYFDRALTVGALSVLGIMLMGYYELNYLKKTYSDIIRDLKNIMAEDAVISFKEKMEKLRDEQESLKFSDDRDKKIKTMVFEKDLGLGIKKTMNYELSDFEIFISELNRSLKYVNRKSDDMIYKDFLTGKIKFEARFNNLIIREMAKLMVRAS